MKYRAKLFANIFGPFDNTPVFMQYAAVTGHTGDNLCQPNSIN